MLNTTDKRTFKQDRAREKKNGTLSTGGKIKNCNTSHQKICVSENDGIQEAKSGVRNPSTSEFYSQQKCPSKMKVK